MKALFLLLTVFSLGAWAQDYEDQEAEMSDQQRCEEWAAIDGIAQEDMQGYIQECLASLNYEDSMGEETAAEVE